MVQVIGQGRVKPKSFSQQIGEGVSRLAQMGSAYALQEHETNKAKQLEEQRYNQEIDTLNKLSGMDLRGIRNPKILEQAAKHGFDSKQLSPKLANQQAQQELVAKALTGQKLTQEEQAMLPANIQTQLARINAPPKKTQASQPIDEDQLNRIKEVRSEPGFEDKSPKKQFEAMIDAGVSKENAHVYADISAKEAELGQKSFESSYKANEDFINDTTRAYKSFETDTKPRLMQMQRLASDEELIGPTSAAFLEAMHIPLGALEDPSSELYQKVSLDLLKGLPESFGNRIMKVEVDNFLKTIPTLLNSAEGRRMIASNMLKLGEMKEVYYNEMRRQQKDALEKNKFPRDFQQNVFDQVKPQVDRINDEFVKMSSIKVLPKGQVPFFSPSGQIIFIPKDKIQEASERGGRRIW